VRIRLKKKEIILMEQASLEELKVKPHIIYYSKNSKPAMILFDKIEKDENLSILFRPICVDYQVIEHQIRSVPTLILNKKEMISGKDAFEWIENNQIKEFDLSFSQYSTNFANIDDSYMANGFEQLGNNNSMTVNDNSLNNKDMQVQNETRQLMEVLKEKRSNDVPAPIQRV